MFESIKAGGSLPAGVYLTYPNIMWKAILPGEKVTVGDTIRYQPSSSQLSYKDKVYLVIKTEQHYFEIVIKADNEDGEHTDRKVIKYIDIGYHLGLEVWSEPAPVLQERG